MLNILIALGAFVACGAAFCTWVTLVYRLVLFKQYAIYRDLAQSEGRVYNWWRFAQVHHWQAFLGTRKWPPANPIEWITIVVFIFAPMMMFVDVVIVG